MKVMSRTMSVCPGQSGVMSHSMRNGRKMISPE